MGATGNQRDGAVGEASSDVSPPEDLVLALRDSSRALLSFLTAQARANGLGLPDLITLARSAEGEGIAPYEAGRSLGLAASTMSALADRLERAGLIRRTAHPTDRRLLLLKATPRGHTLLDHMLDPLLRSLTQLSGTASAEEAAFLARFLEQTTGLLLEHAATAAAAKGGVARRATVRRRPRPLAPKSYGN